MEQLLEADGPRTLAAHHIHYCLNLALICFIDDQGIFEKLLQLDTVQELREDRNDGERSLEYGLGEGLMEEFLLLSGFECSRERLQYLFDMLREMLQDVGLIDLEELGLGEDELGI